MLRFVVSSVCLFMVCCVYHLSVILTEKIMQCEPYFPLSKIHLLIYIHCMCYFSFIIFRTIILHELLTKVQFFISIHKCNYDFFCVTHRLATLKNEKWRKGEKRWREMVAIKSRDLEILSCWWTRIDMFDRGSEN